MNVINPRATTKKIFTATNKANGGNRMKSELCDSV